MSRNAASATASNPTKEDFLKGIIALQFSLDALGLTAEFLTRA